MSKKKKKKKKHIQNTNNKRKKKKKKASKKKVVLKSTIKEEKKLEELPKETKTTNKNKKIKGIIKPKKEKKKINFLYIAVILMIVGIVIYSAYTIYKIQEAEYNRLTNYIAQSNLQTFEIQFEDKKEKQTEWQKINENYLIETYARNNIIHIKDTNSGNIKDLTNNDFYFDYFGEDYYLLTSDGEYTIDYIYYNGNSECPLTFVSDNDSVIIDNNKITCNKSGKTTIYATFGEEKIKVLDIKASSLIINRPIQFDETKPFLSCEQYTKEENDELDEILEEKINNVGYLTRAGSVEALRFMTLDIPYRVSYFYENGRLPNVDAEGRYYHKGLYLSNDRYNYIKTRSKNMTGTWGCKIYSIPYDGKTENGLDCSGLISWALYNAGYDPDDIRGSERLLELGNEVSSKSAVESGKIKVGDLVHNYEADGHIGMLIGLNKEDGENIYYVAQSIWYKPKGVCISKYTEKQFIKHWVEVGLMDDYYKKDGNLTNMWY